jgi:hypothetical protein
MSQEDIMQIFELGNGFVEIECDFKLYNTLTATQAIGRLRTEGYLEAVRSFLKEIDNEFQQDMLRVLDEISLDLMPAEDSMKWLKLVINQIIRLDSAKHSEIAVLESITRL